MPKPVALEVLFADDNYVAIAKPPGLAVIPGRAETTSALEQLAAQLRLPCTGQDDPRLRVVHRIDKDTSGLVIFAKNRPAQAHLSHQFQNNRVEKEYLALVVGSPLEEKGQIDAPLAPHPAAKDRMSISKHGRPARTLWQIENRFRTYTLLRVFPKTGKTHQIRVHLKSIGHPLAVDPLYNPPAPGQTPGLFLSAFKRSYRPGPEGERPLIPRLTLHAEKLRFSNMQGQPLQITAPLPKDFRAALNMLTKYAR